MVLGDVGDHLLVDLTGQQQVGPGGHRRQHRAQLRPALGDGRHRFTQQLVGVLKFPRVVQELLVELLLRVPASVCDSRQPGRFHETNQVGRHGKAHIMAAPLQLQADRCAGLDVAASPIAGHDKFHEFFMGVVSPNQSLANK